MPYRGENILRKEEIAWYKQFLLFSPYFPQLYIFSVSKCSIVWLWVKVCVQMLSFLAYPQILYLEKDKTCFIVINLDKACFKGLTIFMEIY